MANAVCLCITLTQAILATSDEGVHALSLFWRRFKLFLPIWGEPRRLTKEVRVHFMCIASRLELLSSTSLAIQATLAVRWDAQRTYTTVYNRIIAVAWIHLLCAVACVALAAITGLAFDWAPQFAAAGVGCPLSLLLFFKVKQLQTTVVHMHHSIV
eukprot:2907-Heterococcus_DN1.PRE.3